LAADVVITGAKDPATTPSDAGYTSSALSRRTIRELDRRPSLDIEAAERFTQVLVQFLEATPSSDS